jgi:molybdopterin molybdotransferase
MAVPGRISAGHAGPAEAFRCPRRQDYMRASLDRGAEGILVATSAADQDSSLVKTMARADGLIVRPPHAEPAKTGDLCRVIPFHGLGV